MARLTVAACAQYSCIESAIIKGRLLAEAIGGEVEYHVHTPVNKKGLIACLNGADYTVFGFHSASHGIQDMREDGSRPTLVLIDDLKSFPEFPA